MHREIIVVLPSNIVFTATERITLIQVGIYLDGLRQSPLLKVIRFDRFHICLWVDVWWEGRWGEKAPINFALHAIPFPLSSINLDMELRVLTALLPLYICNFALRAFTLTKLTLLSDLSFALGLWDAASSARILVLFFYGEGDSGKVVTGQWMTWIITEIPEWMSSWISLLVKACMTLFSATEYCLLFVETTYSTSTTVDLD
jgi:hypothetical protein